MSLLFSPIKIGSFSIKNRLMRSATAEKLFEEDGSIKSELLKMYQDLAKGGVGVIISGHLGVSQAGKAHAEMGMLHEDWLIPELRRLTDIVHQYKGAVFAQINHAGAKANGSGIETFLAPSAVMQTENSPPARAMIEEEIVEVIAQFCAAAKRAKDAGFDGVQIHAAHGYLTSQFLSPIANKREDRWGGSLENRARFLLGLVSEIRKSVGDDYPVGLKLGVIDDDPDGLSFEDSLKLIEWISGDSIDLIEISCGIGGKSISAVKAGVRNPEEEAYFRHYAREIKAVTEIPIALVGGIRSRGVMDSVLDLGDADMISLCRPLINDPYFPASLRAGQTEISGCISGSRCWPKENGEGIACKCGQEKRTK